MNTYPLRKNFSFSQTARLISTWLKRPLAIGLWLGASLLTAAPPAAAGMFTVSPVRIYMAPNDRAIAVTVLNEGDEPIVMQADLYNWKQKADGSDDLVLTEDIFLSPPIIKLAPKAKQVVRLARLTNAPTTEQLTYRMILRELPEARKDADKLQLQIALAFSMPVFITPPSAKAQLNCRLANNLADKVMIECENSGNAHSHPTDFEITDSSGAKVASTDSGAYLLAGTKRQFELKKLGKTSSGKATIKATLDDASTKTYEVTLP